MIPMLGDSAGLLGGGGEEGAATAAAEQAGGGGGSSVAGIGEDEKGRMDEFGERVGSGAAGNRWPQLETLALLKIRSDMDLSFRDSSLKGPLWEEVSRKMAELGYQRSAKKCKEKFENVYKYHKRTKEGRAGKSDGKTYRFFDQLEAFESINPHHHHHLPALPPPLPSPLPSLLAAHPVTMSPTATAANLPSTPAADDAEPLNSIHPTAAKAPSQNMTQFQHQLQQRASTTTLPSIFAGGFLSSTPSSSSSTSSDDGISGKGGKRKRKWKDFFERLMKEVIGKQEELQRKFLEAIEKREHERLAREESWKVQEMARLNREHEILVQERSMAAAKDAALIAFLQKLADKQQINPLPLQLQLFLHQQPQANSTNASDANATGRQSLSAASPAPAATQLPRPASGQSQSHQMQLETSDNSVAILAAKPPPNSHQQPTNGEKEGSTIVPAPLPPSSSRWPKAEVQALIDLRTNMDHKYQESGPKGQLWEEISAAMRRLGYYRSAKRCKEKWENINKYFKKVKESNRKRPEDSKTCPYFRQLDAIYRQKSISRIEYNIPPMAGDTLTAASASSAPIMARPEQQWPIPDDPGRTNGPEDDINDSEDDVGDENEDDDQGYEFIANTNTAAAAAKLGTRGEGGGGIAKTETVD